VTSDRGAGRPAELIARVGDVELAYETFGDPADPPLLMIMGLAAQMVHWPVELCELLVARGFHVIRFDNRDAGHSTHMSGGPRPNVMRAMVGNTRSASYTLDDMAADSAGLLDHLGVEAAHVVGASMGGMIAQTLALRHPQRVLSLASIMSTTGERRVGRPRLRAFALLLRKAPRERGAYIQYVVRLFRTIGSPGFARDEERLRELAAETYDRGYDRAATARQLVAIQASGDRTRALAGLDVPTVVIHGSDDPLIRVRAGRATAQAIPDAKLVEIKGMGHDLPLELWPRFTDEIAQNAERARSTARA
jgi:pimeloyl-ACP methyl ester carboxylesterase